MSVRGFLGGLVLFFGLSAGMVAAQDTGVSGEQIRGKGRSGQLICMGINLPNGGIILSASGNGDGFWIEGPFGVRNYNSFAKATNVSLPKGFYRVFPNLKMNQDRAGVTVKIRQTPVPPPTTKPTPPPTKKPTPPPTKKPTTAPTKVTPPPTTTTGSPFHSGVFVVPAKKK